MFTAFLRHLTKLVREQEDNLRREIRESEAWIRGDIAELRRELDEVRSLKTS